MMTNSKNFNSFGDEAFCSIGPQMITLYSKRTITLLKIRFQSVYQTENIQFNNFITICSLAACVDTDKIFSFETIETGEFFPNLELTSFVSQVGISVNIYVIIHTPTISEVSELSKSILV